MRRMPRESHLTTLHFEYADAGQGDPYGRVAERPVRPGASQARVSGGIPTSHHSPLPPETGRPDILEGFPRYGKFFQEVSMIRRTGLRSQDVSSILGDGAERM
ncbi:hypothetical protein PAXRUDRAFT_823748 [Paxillus rubicundulus Ve08.2h10]|uniref:Uncharacterized protein n=1 Tax=Paxillus rubicundulus Ve08.2h10 TaxID=930991 RepID=A0A0D0DJI8_9AGAM|nr:hypothetical protein PAXRUDRAFT_823748 [Paxillus rubicundulus Ve08.2h10]